VAGLYFFNLEDKFKNDGGVRSRTSHTSTLAAYPIGRRRTALRDAVVALSTIGVAVVLAATVGATVQGLAGVLEAALLLSTWLYFGAIRIVLGAVVNATAAGRGPASGGTANADRQVQHPGPRQQ